VAITPPRCRGRGPLCPPGGPTSKPAHAAALRRSRGSRSRASRLRRGSQQSRQGKAGSGLRATGSSAPGRRRRHGGAFPPPRRERNRPERPYRRHPRDLRGAPSEPLWQRQGGEEGRGALARRAVVSPLESPGAGPDRGLRHVHSAEYVRESSLDFPSRRMLSSRITLPPLPPP
jgi:hypothetical protein